MTKKLPAWAFRTVTKQDRERSARAHALGTLQVVWPEKKVLRDWAKQQDWPAPRFGFEGKFIDTMLASDDNFALALHAGRQLRQLDWMSLQRG